MKATVGRFVALILLLALFSNSSSAHAQSTARVNIDYIENSQFPILEVYASVTNAQGFPLKNLSSSNFTVSEDGQLIHDFEVLPVQNKQQPLAIALVIDTSGSMTGSSTPTPLQDAVNAAKTFVDALSQQDQVAVVGFADAPYTVQDLTNDKGLVKAKLDSLVAKGNTTLYDGIVQAVGLLKNRPERKIMVLITDGIDSSMGKFDYKTSMDEVKRWVIPVYPIGFGSVDQRELEQIAILTGGLAQIKPDSSNIQSSFNVVLQVLREQYLIRYTSKIIADGSVHNLQISAEGQTATQSFIALPRTITIEMPFQEGQVVGGMVLLEPKVIAPAPVAELEILLDGDPLQTILSEPFQYAWNSTTVAPGAHHFMFNVKDSAGNTAQQDLNLNVKPPITVQFVTPNEQQELSGESKIVVDIQALAGIAKIEYTIDEKAIQTVSNPPYDITINWDKYSKGPHLLNVKATDVNGFSATQEMVIQAKGTGDIWFLILVIGIAVAALGVPIGLKWRRKPDTVITQSDHAIIRQIAGTNAGQTWMLGTEDMKIGRKRTNDIQLKSAKASRENAIIRYENGQYILYNRSGDNPPLVNNTSVAEKRVLQPNDSIQFGEDILRYEQ